MNHGHSLQQQVYLCAQIERESKGDLLLSGLWMKLKDERAFIIPVT